MEPRKINRYGWRPGLPDMNAPKFGAQIGTLATLPEKVDLRPYDNPIYDQGDLGACTAMAIGGMVQFVLKHDKKTAFVPSRLFIYYNERAIEGTIEIDAGASLIDGMRVVSRMGCPNESLWWYNTVKFKQKPNQSVYNDGLKHKVQSYLGLNNASLSELKTCLALGYPFVFGSAVFSGIETASAARTGIIPLPKRGEEALGGHALMCVGYNDATKYFTIRNSWNKTWGDSGYGYMPYEYLTNLDLSQDFWTIRKVN